MSLFAGRGSGGTRQQPSGGPRGASGGDCHGTKQGLRGNAYQEHRHHPPQGVSSLQHDENYSGGEEGAAVLRWLLLEKTLVAFCL